MARIEIFSNSTSGGGSVATGVLQLLNGVAMSATLTSVTDQNNTTSPLKLSTTGVQIVSPLRITTSDASGFYLDAEDSATNNRFSIKRDPSSQEVTLDFASNPAGSTTLVGAIRTFGDGVNLSAAMSFIEDGSIGMGTNAPSQKVHIVGSLRVQSGGIYDGTNNIGTNGQVLSSTGTATAWITPATTSPAGSTGAVQFNNAGAFGADSSNFFWDDTNNRLGIGTNAPSATTHIKGSGSTSATTSLLVQNSAGTAALTIKDDMQVSLPSTASNNTLAIGGQVGVSKNGVGVGYSSGSSVLVRGGLFVNPNSDTVELYGSSNSIMSWVNGEVLFKNANNGASISNPSAIVTIDSTTRGFLPPRMTTAQKNAIATPAAGLMVYDTNLNKLCVYTTAWETITSV